MKETMLDIVQRIKSIDDNLSIYIYYNKSYEYWIICKEKTFELCNRIAETLIKHEIKYNDDVYYLIFEEENIYKERFPQPIYEF